MLMEILHHTPEHIAVAAASVFAVVASKLQHLLSDRCYAATSGIRPCCSSSLWALIAFTVETGDRICFEYPNQILNRSLALFHQLLACLPAKGFPFKFIQLTQIRLNIYSVPYCYRQFVPLYDLEMCVLECTKAPHCYFWN